jgi:predicted NBD/HSP70 family sugar kinase
MRSTLFSTLSLQAGAQQDATGRNLEHARAHNRRAVLDLIRRTGEMSRPEIARRTALSLQTISNIVEELEQAGFLRAGGSVRGKRGQPYVPFSVNPKGGWTIGLNIARHTITGALVDLAGQMVAAEEIMQDPATPAILAPIVAALCDRLLARGAVPRQRVLGIGCALPVRFDLGAISTAPPTGLPGWEDPEARRCFRESFFAPVILENDAVTAAINEHLNGVARDIDNFVLLYLEEGLGAGLFLNGRPFTGARDNAGEIGHMVVMPDGRPCGCGNRGCAERYLSLRAAYEVVAPDPDQWTPAALNAAFEADPAALVPWFESLRLPLTNLMHVLEMVLAPDTVIIGGPASPAIIDRVIAAAQPLPPSVSAYPDRRLPRLMPGTIGRYASAFGAAALPIYSEISPSSIPSLAQ